MPFCLINLSAKISATDEKFVCSEEMVIKGLPSTAALYNIGKICL